MIYEPFLGMHVLVSDDLLQAISAFYQALLLLCVAVALVVATLAILGHLE